MNKKKYINEERTERKQKYKKKNMHPKLEVTQLEQGNFTDQCNLLGGKIAMFYGATHCSYIPIYYMAVT